MARRTPKKFGQQESSAGGGAAPRQSVKQALAENPTCPRRASRPLIVFSGLLFLGWLVTLGVVASRL
jgi:hypothetical protein